MEARNNRDVIREHLSLDGSRVIDVGCGEGTMTRFLAREGARVTGVECGAESLARARAAAPVADEDYLFGYGEDLPLDDSVADVVTFFNSLHHVPVANQTRALMEAARVLKPRAMLYVQEPIAAGASFELMAPVDDETEVRARAVEAIENSIDNATCETVLEYVYVTRYSYRDFDEFRDSVLLVDPARAARFVGVESELRERFVRLGEKDADGWWFEQPMRLNLLRRLL